MSNPTAGEQQFVTESLTGGGSIKYAKPTTGDLEARITEYLCAGGLFNPELMEHEKVRDLLMDCRAALAAERESAANAWLNSELGSVKKLREQLATTVEAMLDVYEELHARYDLGDCQATVDARAALDKIGAK